MTTDIIIDDDDFVLCYYIGGNHMHHVLSPTKVMALYGRHNYGYMRGPKLDPVTKDMIEIPPYKFLVHVSDIDYYDKEPLKRQLFIPVENFDTNVIKVLSSDSDEVKALKEQLARVDDFNNTLEIKLTEVTEKLTEAKVENETLRQEIEGLKQQLIEEKTPKQLPKKKTPAVKKKPSTA